MSQIDRLYDRLQSVDMERFFELDGEFFMELWGAPAQRRPDCAVAFMMLSSWWGVSVRSGVWTYYESQNPADIRTACQYLSRNAPADLARMYSLGIHPYQDPAYQDASYPESWIEESEQIDRWIMDHEQEIWAYERRLLLEERAAICGLFES